MLPAAIRIHHCHHRVGKLGWAGLAYRDVTHKPIVQEGSVITDQGIRGVDSHTSRYCLILRVTDSDAPSYHVSLCYWRLLLRRKEEVPDCCWGHCAFEVTTDGALGHDAVLFMGYLVESTGLRVMMRCTAGVRLCCDQVTDLCLRGSHASWRSGTSIG